MSLLRRRTDPTALPVDWLPLATAMCEVVPAAAASWADVDGAVGALPDATLLSAAVHVQRLVDVACSPATARALRRHPFVDWDTPWDAGLVSQITPRALAWAYDDGACDPGRTAAALRGVATDLGALAAFGEALPAVVDRAAELMVVWLGLQRAALRRLGRATRPPLSEVLPSPFTLDLESGDWRAAPAGWLDRRWAWDRTWEPIALDERLHDPAAADLEDARLLLPVADRLLLSGPPGEERVTEPGTPPGEVVAAWLDWVVDALDLVVLGLTTRLRRPEPEAADRPVLTEPWTDRPWRLIDVRVHVVPGGDVVVHRLEDRALQVVLPVDPTRLAPADEVVVAFAKVLAQVLLVHVPDLTPHARAVLTAEAAGHPDSLASVQADLAVAVERKQA